MPNQAKLEAQEALYTAIKDQAETNMKSALRAAEKAQLLRDLAEAYRLTAGGSVPVPAVAQGPTGGRQRAATGGPRADRRRRRPGRGCTAPRTAGRQARAASASAASAFSKHSCGGCTSPAPT